MTDQRLRDLYRQALQGREPVGHCPAPEALLALARREGPEAARLGTLDHVMGCTRCRSELDLLRAIEKAGGPVVSTPRRGRYLALAIAASLLLAFGLAPLVQYWQRNGSEPTRGAAAELTLLAPAAGEVAAPPVTFAWRPAPKARGYTIELLRGDGSVAFGTTTADTVLVLPVGRQPAPGQYRWWVRTRETGGTERRSDLRALRLQGK